MLSAIIVAGGSSRRMGFDKVFAPIGGKPCIAHSIAAFQRADCVNEIIIVARSEIRLELQSLVTGERFDRVRAIVVGGEHRHDSVRAGIAAAGDNATHIAVHDAARPLITAEEIVRVYEVAAENGAAVLARAITDTVKRATAQNSIVESIDRTGLFAMQTPQIFERALLQRAYEEVVRRSLAVTDEVSAMQLIGHDAMVVPNQAPNFKITYPRDLQLAELILSARR